MSPPAPRPDLGLHGLLPVPPEAAHGFDSARPELVARLDATLFRRPDLGVLLGDATSSSVRELHRYLAAFLSSVFTLGLPELLRDGLPRLLSGYRNRGLPEDYFQALPDLWCQALQDQMGPRSQPLTRVWEWLRDHPGEWSPGAVSPSNGASKGSDAVGPLVTALLSGDAPGARSVIRSAVDDGSKVEQVFVDLIQPALYEIGHRWAQGRISAAQEHLASALVARILPTLHEVAPGPDERVAVVTTAPTETHEFGAWMVSDVLRNAGWTVRFLGSQLPADEILHFMRQVQPQLLAVSVTLEIHLPSLQDLIRRLREDEAVADVPVLVGGQAFSAGEPVWRAAGADGMARDAREVASVASELTAPGAGADQLN